MSRPRRPLALALAAYPLLGLHREPAPVPAARDRGKARLATALGGGLLAILTVGVLLATPYLSSKTFSRSAAQVATSAASIWEVSLDRATVSVEAGPGFEASYDVQAFGFPTSKMGFAFREEGGAAVLTIEPVGWFTERRTQVKLVLPRDGEKPVRLRLGQGRVALDLRSFAPSARLDVEVGEGTVRVIGAAGPDGDRVRVHVGKGDVVRDGAPAR